MMATTQKSRSTGTEGNGEAALPKRCLGDQSEVTDEYTSQYDAKEAHVMTTIEAREEQHAAALRRADERAAERELKRMLKNPVIGDSQEVAFSGRSFKRLLTWGIMLLLLVPLLVGLFGGGTAFANEEAEEVDEETEQITEGLGDYSFYSMSANLADIFSRSVDPTTNTTDEFEDFHDIRRHPGSAGSFVGYLDPSFFEDGFSTWLTSNLSSSSAAMAYESLLAEAVDSDGEPINIEGYGQGFYNYATYGAALSDMGFAETSAGFSVFDGVNAVMGGIIWIFWVIAYVVDFLFWLFVQILIALNPFRWFYYGVYAISPELADGMTGGAGGQSDIIIGLPDNDTTGGALNIQIPGALQGFLDWVGGWYELLYDISTYVMVPLFIGTFLMGLFLFRRFDKGSSTRKLLVRLVFIALGLPILGSMYSSTLNTMAEGLNPGSTGSTQVVLSTYVDFERWATEQRLEVPDDAVIEWDRDSSSVTPATLGALRSNALLINTLTHDDLTPLNSNSFGGENVDWSEAQMEDMAPESHGSEEESNFSIVSGIITRSMFMDHTTAPAFETEIKARIADRFDNLPDAEDGESHLLETWFSTAEDGDGDTDFADNPLISVSAESNASSNNIGLQATWDDNERIIEYSSNTAWPGFCDELQTWHGETHGPRACNLSPMAVFNFLNTSFDSTSLTVYSSGNVASEFTRQTYNSVNPVGTGIMRFAIWANSVAILVSFVVIGVVYAFAMLFGALKRTMQVVGSIPFATLGALGAIGKLVVYTLALIVQTIGTIFLFMFAQSLLISLPSIIEAPFAALMNWAAGSGSAVLGFMSGTAVTLLTILLSIVASIGFMIVAIKARGSVMKALEEAVSKVVEKLTGSSTGGSSGPGALSRAAQGAAGGAAGGAGAAAANRAISNRSGSGGHSSSGQRNSPSKVTTAGAAGTGALAGLSKDELRKKSEEAGGSPDPTSENYDKHHPDAPDYDPAVAGEQGHVAETDPDAQDDADGDGKTESRYQGGEIAESDEQMSAASEDQEEGQRVEREGLSLNGEAPQEYATAADQPEREDSAGEGLATDVQQGAEDAAHDERSLREQGADIASSGKDYAAGTGHALIGNESGAAERGADGEAKITGEGAHSESSAERSQLDQRHSEGADSETRSVESAYGEGQHTAEQQRDHEATEQSQREVQAQQDATHEQRTDADGNPVPGPVGAGAAGTTTAAAALDKNGQKLGPDGKPLPGQKPGTPSNVIGGDVTGGTANVDASSSQRSSVAESASHTDRSSTAQSQSVDQSQRSDSTVNQQSGPAVAEQPGQSGASEKPEKPNRISATAQGAGKGAAKGAAAGAAVGLVGGPKGAAAGAKVGAVWGARSGGTEGAVHRDGSGKVNPLNRKGRKAMGKSAKTGKSAGKPPQGPRPQQAPKPPAPAPQPKPPRNDGTGPGGDQ